MRRGKGAMLLPGGAGPASCGAVRSRLMQPEVLAQSKSCIVLPVLQPSYIVGERCKQNQMPYRL